MEVKVGIANIARELVFESNQKPEEIQKMVREALSKGELLTFTDDKGRSLCVPAEKLAYVEIGEQFERRVGFGAL